MLKTVVSTVRRRAVAFAALFLALAGSAYAAATIPGPGGVIHSCYRKSNGSLRVVRAGARCSRREKALNFNQRGPRGFQGARGSQGPHGRTGARGPKGATGTNGATNVQVRTAGPTALPADGVEHDYAAACNGGERATGGGYSIAGTAGPTMGSRPNPTSGIPTGWDVRVATSSLGATISVYVICASP